MSNITKIRQVLGSRITDLLEEEDILTDGVLIALGDVKEEDFPEINCSDVLFGPSFTNSDIDSLRTVQRRYKDIYCQVEISGDVKSKSLSHGQKTPPKEASGDPEFDVMVGSLGNVPAPDHYYELRESVDGKIGRALIIINKNFRDGERLGADKDRDNLDVLFKMLNIGCSFHYDLNAEKMEEEIKNFAMDDSTGKASVVFIAISSHGKSDAILGVDNKIEKPDTISITKIQDLLGGNKGGIKDPRRIPKILVLQACRGSKIQKSKEASKQDIEDIEDPVNFAVNSHDFLILYPTSLYYKAWRSTTDGSWMIEELKNCVKVYKDSHHFIEILTMCTHNLLSSRYEGRNHAKQTCTFKSTLTKFLSFKNLA